MTVSARIQEMLLQFLEDGRPHSVQEMKTCLAQAGMTAYSEGQFSGSINTLLRNKTIQKTDRATYALLGKGDGEKMKYCFVVSPIGDDGSEIRVNADKLFRHIISPVCLSCGFQVERMDQINDSGSITQGIIDKLTSADLVIADVTGHNPNVFYEMGFRKCTGKPIIHLKSKGETLPFDITTIRTFEYDLTDLDNVEEMKERLKKTISSFSFEKNHSETGRSESDEKTNEGIFPLLYQIQDSIVELRNEISKKDTATIQAIMQTSLNNAAKPQESADAALMKTLLPELLKNPDALGNLMKVAEIAKKNTSN